MIKNTQNPTQGKTGVTCDQALLFSWRRRRRQNYSLKTELITPFATLHNNHWTPVSWKSTFWDWKYVFLAFQFRSIILFYSAVVSSIRGLVNKSQGLLVKKQERFKDRSLNFSFSRTFQGYGNLSRTFQALCEPRWQTNYSTLKEFEATTAGIDLPLLY